MTATSESPNLQLRTANYTELPQLALLHQETFHDTPLYRSLFPENRGAPGTYNHLSWYTAWYESHFHLPNHHFMVIVDRAPSLTVASNIEQIAGFAYWIQPELQDQVVPDQIRPYPGIPPYMDELAVVDFITEYNMLLAACLGFGGNANSWVLESVVIRPMYRGRHITRVLVEWGLNQAVYYHQDAFVLASSSHDRRKFEFLGFRALGEIKVFGQTFTAMLRRRDQGRAVRGPATGNGDSD